uniref:F-box/LRR-repeat protein 15-like leucin rich repeat domain-containing protein n=1 Tax=Arcella intermedia TaxID=1963864 RepID=A0A6B2L8W1_9EUKA
MKSFPTKLVSLSLENCTRIKDESLIEYSTLCTSLKHLNLKGCYKLRDKGIIAMAKSSTKLESLSLNKLRQAVNLDSINIILDSCSQLKSLNLLSCSVTDSCLQSISTKLGFNLTSLRIKFCNEVTDEGMRSICLTCLNLEVIDIQGLQKITNATMESISKCDSLVELDLRDCPQIDSGLDKILDNCTYLQVLRMRSPQIRDETISPLIHKGSYLKIIDFQSCINLSFGCIMSLASAQKVHLRRFIIHEIPLDQDQVTELTSIAPFEVTLSLQTPNGLLNVFWNSKIQ